MTFQYFCTFLIIYIIYIYTCNIYYMLVCVYIYAYMYVYICICIYIHIHIYTYIYIHMFLDYPIVDHPISSERKKRTNVLVCVTFLMKKQPLQGIVEKRFCWLTLTYSLIFLFYKISKKDLNSNFFSTGLYSFLNNRLMSQHNIVCSIKINFPSCNKRKQKNEQKMKFSIKDFIKAKVYHLNFLG